MLTSTSLHATTSNVAYLVNEFQYTRSTLSINHYGDTELQNMAPKPQDEMSESDGYDLDELKAADQQKPFRERGKRIRINVSGRIFESYQRTLVSKEGSIFGYSSIMKYYDEENKEFFFDKDPHTFEAILVYLQCGLLQQPEKVDFKAFIEDLQFFGFGDKAYHIYRREAIIPDTSCANQGTREEIGFRLFLYNMLEYPDINLTAQIFAGLTSFIIFISIIVYCIESLPSMHPNAVDNLSYVEAFCVVWFTIELSARFILCPEKLKFVKSLMNWVDLVSIVPFYITILMPENKDSNVVGLAMLRVLRVARVFRVFKLSRYSKAIYLIILTISTSVRELMLLLMFIIILMVLFAAAIYQFEHDDLDEKNKFKSIPHTFWIVIVTITTVGYGDMVPYTPEGQFITSILAITGVVIVALPIPIIVNNFTRFYERIMSKSSKYQFEFDESKSEENKETHLVVTQCESTI
ncbi:potassium voltage-gated channel protein Shaker-like [Clytia hemisphaerica]|uniref:Uncharacterized protein n=1 Tax=Clytia hemisphaerica TaxID=252671 RepID=A0A7M6DLK4_9CNID|eukprot:TCONS_00013421-protein